MRALIHVSGFSNTQRNVVALYYYFCYCFLKIASLPPSCVVILDRINIKRNYLEPTNPSFLVSTRFRVQVSCAIFDVPTTEQPKDHKDY